MLVLGSVLLVLAVIGAGVKFGARATRRVGAVSFISFALVAGSAGVASAETAPVMYTTFGGTSISGATIPGAKVVMTAISSRPVTSVTFSVAGRLLGSSTKSVQVGERYNVTTTVDLTGLAGPTTLRTRFVTATSAASVDKGINVTALPTTTQPGAHNTGVLPGITLTPMSGNIVLNTPGQVFENVDLAGCILVKANNVTIRNSKIACKSPGYPTMVYSKGYYGLTIEDSEINGLGVAQIGLGFSNTTIRRNEITNVNDGIRAASNMVIEGNWVHDMARVGTLHPDAIQSTGGTNITIRNNTLNPYNNVTGNLQNAAIMMGSETAPQLANVLVEGNYLEGGNRTVNVRGDVVASNVVFRNNVFGPASRYGAMQAPVSIDVDASNILSSTGLPIKVLIVK